MNKGKHVKSAVWWFQEPQSGKIEFVMFSVCKDASLSHTVHSMKRSNEIFMYQNVKVFIFVILMYFVFLLFECVTVGQQSVTLF